MGPDVCCFKYYTKRFPVKRVRSYKKTNPNCPKKGVIFITVRGKKVCANPNVQQTKDIMEKLDKLW
ncbi:C-C motif chemokine 4 homolog [Clupea harengus]|uniref:C-C motif chemokine 4 homolog n=1 Tax=Clupea harengus TaxID=7950 RepID=A0A8M1KTD9_CLUHA|nr:C-C motif chemokine 4 homolog [Clupea harengus]